MDKHLLQSDLFSLIRNLNRQAGKGRAVRASRRIFNFLKPSQQTLERLRPINPASQKTVSIYSKDSFKNRSISQACLLKSMTKDIFLPVFSASSGGGDFDGTKDFLESLNK